MEKLFRLQTEAGREDVLGGAVALENVYVSVYGKVVKGNPPDKLGVDEFCVKEYALSGQKATRYVLVRVQ